MPLTVSEFDFDLPPTLIAQSPLAERSASRLLRVAPDTLEDLSFRDLPSLLAPGDLLVFNDSRVLHARLYGRKSTGGEVEVLIERPLGDHEALAMVRASKSPKPGSRMTLMDAFDVEVLGRVGEFFHLRFPQEATVIELIERHGRLPLPPYIDRAAAEADEARYQTVYARHLGSVAAPTAGLHFDQTVLDQLAARGVKTAAVTLHVGAGTFQPVRVERIEDHVMHREWYVIPEDTVAAITATRAAGGRVVCVGTTSLRALESAARDGELKAGAEETDIFITPGFQFRVADRLITNFHLPRSTLLMLVSAFAGLDTIRNAYAHAIANRYRFFSYGDAMLLDKAST
ncbi:tRNA preQ1(34) S-adenosylmethionine ribosyltransferase-isomerase QueA [Niveibacterium microcysteis]|uniref:S-adenosylmethionine:tRNA ribosyltransferase-isomerase n=1 Tax=Niveibacterium microcysteis TaxID=2811415 RepID=A0ABX7M7W5_9RHOO|nr:tRNA preQ1(34) S-adenosylmethionine ribosyltransferase-isomerase QueA [Niveibacterium microcysteis]QSI77842.1 tRNA preQ1(34) S-adenosylmethionine ribosyltransferase-isomerase QueA [Niveibacterium microcysteis]